MVKKYRIFPTQKHFFSQTENLLSMWIKVSAWRNLVSQLPPVSSTGTQSKTLYTGANQSFDEDKQQWSVTQI